MSEYIPLVEGSEDVDILGDIKVPARFYNRISTGVPALDEVFGGAEMPGLLPGCSVLFTGIPGAGKSTLCLQLADLFQRAGRSVLYNMGEENVYMVKMRADRLGLRQRFCTSSFSETEKLIDYCLETGVEILFQDSLQSLRDGELSGNRLLKQVTKKMHNLSKDDEVNVFLIGHVTKGNIFAGPQEVKHDLDAHAHLKMDDGGLRTLELEKNRFGPAMIPYSLTMGAQGLDLQMLPSTTVEVREGPQGTSRASERRERIARLIRDRLLAGDSLSGYCFERLGADCSGGFWRALVMKVTDQLRTEGVNVVERRIEGRTHAYIPQKGA